MMKMKQIIRSKISWIMELKIIMKIMRQLII